MQFTNVVELYICYLIQVLAMFSNGFFPICKKKKEKENYFDFVLVVAFFTGAFKYEHI